MQYSVAAGLFAGSFGTVYMGVDLHTVSCNATRANGGMYLQQVSLPGQQP